MNSEQDYRPLTGEEISRLQQQRCTADDWSRVTCALEFSTENIWDAHFHGDIRLGLLNGSITVGEDDQRPAGIYRATLRNCQIGNGVRISQVGSGISNYDIGENAVIEDVGAMVATPGSKFGNGVEVAALNEGGGREAVIFDHLSAQFAFLQVAHRSQPAVTAQLTQLAEKAASRAQRERGTIGRGTRVTQVTRMTNVAVGDGAILAGAAELENGTILSTAEAPTTVGTGVVAEDFIIAEGTTVSGGAVLDSCFVGQGCRVGKQFSAEGSLFFANCEAFHGEACSVFAGPYTVTHHKSTLLIAGMFSFYNAGSGTNQSNHMYKLGPVHEGKLERGCKTGSFSYMMWPCRVGPFSVVLGKHTRTFDTRDFPFSHIEAKADGRCEMVPGLYLSTVGTVRDEAKWPQRDRRGESDRRDRLHFKVLNPMTVGRMLRGVARLEELKQETPRTKKTVSINGAEVSRVLLRTGSKYYRSGIEMYLLEALVSRVESARAAGNHDLRQVLAVDPDAVMSEDWIDLAGQLLPRRRFDDLCGQLESGQLESVEQVEAELTACYTAYEQDEWAWVHWAYKQIFDRELESLDEEGLQQAAQHWKDVRTKFLKLIANDAAKEFEEVTQTGFGHSDAAGERLADFTGVRGTLEENNFFGQLQAQIAEVEDRANAI